MRPTQSGLRQKPWEPGEMSCSSLCYLRYLLFKFTGFHAIEQEKRIEQKVTKVTK